MDGDVPVPNLNTLPTLTEVHMLYPVVLRGVIVLFHQIDQVLFKETGPYQFGLYIGRKGGAFFLCAQGERNGEREQVQQGVS